MVIGKILFLVNQVSFFKFHSSGPEQLPLSSTKTANTAKSREQLSDNLTYPQGRSEQFIHSFIHTFI